MHGVLGFSLPELRVEQIKGGVQVKCGRKITSGNQRAAWMVLNALSRNLNSNSGDQGLWNNINQQRHPFRSLPSGSFTSLSCTI